MDHDKPVAVRDAGVIPSAPHRAGTSVPFWTMGRSLPDAPADLLDDRQREIGDNVVLGYD